MNRAGTALTAGLALVFATGFTVIQDPNTQTPTVWPTRTVTFVIQENGSDDVVDGSDVTALQDALGAWGQPACSDFQFANGGSSPSRAIAQDGVNRITFLESNWPGGANGAGAFTVRYRNTATSPATWLEADIRINGEAYSWDTHGNKGSIDVQSVAVHELGHAVGMAHSANPEATMYFVTSRGMTNNRTLHADDIAGLCFLYPSMPFSCASDADCPLVDASYGGTPFRMQCSGGACQPGGASAGMECFSNADCAQGMCVVDPIGPPSSDPRACSQPCSVAAQDCSAGSYCSAVDGTPRCYPGRECVAPEDCALVNPMCRRDQDGRYTCLQACEENRHCPPGQVCFWGEGMPPAGFCKTVGTLPAGMPCDNGLQCQSLACTGGGVTPTCADSIPGFVADAGMPDAAVTLPDAGAVDANMAADASPATDAAPPQLDAAMPDATAPDARVPDAAMGADAAFPPDAAEVPRDASAQADARPQDAAVAPQGGDADSASDASGCACNHASPSGLGLLAVGLLGAWMQRTRRRIR